MTAHLDFATLLTQDLDDLNLLASDTQRAGLAIEATAADRARLYLPLMRELFPNPPVRRYSPHREPPGNFATAAATPGGYGINDFALRKVSVLRAALDGYAREAGSRYVPRDRVADVFGLFNWVFSMELTEHGVTPTPGRVLSLWAFRYARGLGKTVNHQYSQLPDQVYEYLAADIDSRLIILNLSYDFNPGITSARQLTKPPIPLSEAARLAHVPARMLRELYAPQSIITD